MQIRCTSSASITPGTASSMHSADRRSRCIACSNSAPGGRPANALFTPSRTYDVRFFDLGGVICTGEQCLATAAATRQPKHPYFASRGWPPELGYPHPVLCLPPFFPTRSLGLF
ncbi:hypothetical protein K505DRAFT_106055 [Melanomma pulvis-pyrius CBS 109.77]|uniref:Uncharacterized protein n=1 Tax=Melanomma pulvis-pyrius CBS 109.77 TaxID=1314802 RepID=A0A6A6WWW7_9PLEO|nr:hypothetical protein K505DRAFT_106055 [Melanomma pulvis-pyrius CBS 109.77]